MSKPKTPNQMKSPKKKDSYNTFSIIIANYNYEAHVAEAIQSGLNQDYPHANFEVIVVDDGSTDNSRQVIAEIAAKNDNLRVITQTNLGQAAAFYAGVNAAKYEWICLLDSDDYFKPEKLSVLNTFINKQHANFDFICHNVDAVDELNKTHQDWFLRQNISGDYLSVDDAKGGYPYANPCGQVYRKSLLQKIAPWLNLSEWQRGADNPLAWASLFMNGRVCYLHQSLAVYRIHANNFFMASNPNGLVPKVNWLERWPKLITFLNYLHQANASSYISNEDRGALLTRLDQFLKFWQKQLSQKQGVPFVSFITTCKNRLHHLKQTLPRMVKQSNAEVIVVDYGCTQGTRDWVKANYPQVKVVEVDDDSGWSVSRARNLGAAQAKADWLCFIDADMLLQGDLGKWITHKAFDGEMYQADPMPSASSKGTVICQRDKYVQVGGYDEVYRGWFPEDGDFYASLDDIKIKRKGFPARFIVPIEHGDDERAFGEIDQMQKSEHSMQAALIYRMLKVDLLSLTGVSPDIGTRKKLLGRVMDQVKKMHATGRPQDGQVIIAVNNGMSPYQAMNLDRRLVYSPRNIRHIYKSQVDTLLAKNTKPSKTMTNSSDELSTMRIAMFHIGRSGSSVLADMLNQHPAMRWDGEIYESETQKIQKKLGYFHYGSKDCRYDPIGLLKERFDNFKGSAYGYEVKFNQLEHCAVPLEDYLTTIKKMGVNKVIVLRRNNIFRKIVSSLIAEETKVWHVAAGKKSPKKTIRINPQQLTVERKKGSLIDLMDHYLQNLTALDKLLSNTDVLKLSYEEDIEGDPVVGYTKVINYLGLQDFNPKIRLSKTNPYQLYEVVENLEEIRSYLKGTQYEWMLGEKHEINTSAPHIKKIANPAPKLLLDRALSYGEEFVKFTAFAHLFDVKSGKKEALRLLKIKSEFAEKNPNWVGDLTLEQSYSAATKILASIFDRQEYHDRENWLGLSSGYDSRFLLHALRKSSVNFRTFTFGEPGYADYDLPVIISEKLSLNTNFVNLAKLDWSLGLYEKTIPLINDKPLHARVAVSENLIAGSERGEISIIDGYPNNPLIGLKSYKNWQVAKADFIKVNDQFRWHKFFDEKWLFSQFPDEPLVSEDELSSYDQFSLCLRTQRVRPNDYGHIKYLLPYADDDWMSFWLNRTVAERNGHSLFLNMLTQLKLEEFFDFNILAERLKPLNKSEQMRLIYGEGGLMSSRPGRTSIDPFAQICFHSLYLGCESFREMINFSLTRLRKRQIFQPDAIDYILGRFMKADPEAEKMMRGLLTCDVALESNMHVEALKGKPPL